MNAIRGIAWRLHRFSLMFEMERASSKKVLPLPLRDEDKHFLLNIGLPSYAAPGLEIGNFGENEWLPKLKDWSWQIDFDKPIPKELCDHHVIAADPSPICLEFDGKLIYFDIELDYTAIFVNSDLSSFLRCLVLYNTAMNISAQDPRNKHEATAFMSKALASQCLDFIENTDAPGGALGSFWDLAVRERSSKIF